MRLGERVPHQLLELGGGRHGAEKPWVEHRIEQARPPADDVGEPRRRPHDVGDQPEQTWIDGKQREELHARRHLGDHLVEGGKREIGLSGAAEGIEQSGEELGQPLPRAAASRRRIAAGLPGADGGDGCLRIVEAEPLEARERGGVGLVGLDDETRSGAGLGELLEQRTVMGLDPLKLRDQPVAEGVRIGEA